MRPESPGRGGILADIAAYVTDHRVESAAAVAAASTCLMQALAAGFRALQDPACLRLMGPVVSGATMAGGGRVPGTSFELDPPQAAFNIGAMVRWQATDDARLTSDVPHPADNLGAILAVADWLSRRAIAEGTQPGTVRDVATAMIKAHEIQGVLAIEYDLDRVLRVRIASAAVATHALGGSKAQVIDAVSQAWLDGSTRLADRRVPDNGWRPRWATADATSCGVRHALRTVTRGTGSPSVLPAQTPGLQGALFEGKSVGLAAGLGSGMTEHVPLPAWAEQLREFEASVATHFPPVQAAKITALFADRSRLEATPVHEFVAVMVRA